MNPFDLSGKAALVTGGSRGIGAEIAAGLADAGADVAIVHLGDSEGAETVVASLRAKGVRSLAIEQDISAVESLPAALDSLILELGKLDILVNNAGIADLIPFLKVEQHHMERIYQVNVMGPFFLSQAFAKHLLQRGSEGRIINITSTNGIVGEALLSPYNASKGAMELLTKSLAIELGPHGITVNSVAPGLIVTSIIEDSELNSEFWEYARSHVPVGRLGKPADIAGAVVYLASGASSYMNGQHMIVDGGLLADQFPRLQFFTGQDEPANGDQKQ